MSTGLQTYKIKKQFHFLTIRSKLKDFIKPVFDDELTIEKIMLCFSELSTNIMKHAGEGFIQFGFENIEGQHYFVIIARDNGAGIPDIERATQKGYSSKNTLGMGFSILKSNSDIFDIKNLPQGGLFVKAGWQLSQSPNIVDCSFQSNPAKGNISGGDFAIKKIKINDYFICGVFDVLGHGNTVSSFAKEYKSFIEEKIESGITSPHRLLHALNSFVKGKRGCVGTLSKIDFNRPKLVISGVGNIKTMVIIDNKSFEPLLTNGIIENAIKIKEISYEIKKFCTIAMASDGIQEKWISYFKKYYHLTPSVLVKQIFKKFKKDYDDSTMMVATWKLT